MHRPVARAEADHRADEEIVAQKIAVGVAGGGKAPGFPEVRPQRGHARGRLLGELLDIGPQRRVQPRQLHGVGLDVSGVELGVGPGADGFVAAHEQGKASHLHPAGEELAVSPHLRKGEEAADVAVHHGHAGEGEGEARGHDAGHAIVPGGVGVLVAVPEDGRVALDAEVAGAGEEEGVLRAVLLDGLAVDLRPEHGPGVVQKPRVPVVQHAVHRQVFAEVRHPAENAEVEHVFADQRLLDITHRVRMGQIQHAGVEGGGFDMVDAAVLLPDQPALGLAVLIQRAALDEVGVDVGQKTHAARVELFDRAPEIGIERPVDLPVPVDLLAHDGALLARPVLAPDGGDLRPRVEHLKALVQDRLRAALNTEDHALMAPGGQILPVGDARGEQGRELPEALPELQRQAFRAGVEGKEQLVVVGEIRQPVAGGVKEDQPPPVGDKDGHGRIAADAAVGLFEIERTGHQRLFDDGRGLDVLRDKVDHPFAAQVHLPVLLTAAEDGLALSRGEPELVGPAFLARKVQREAVFLFLRADTQAALPGEKAEYAVGLLPQIGERDAGRLRDLGLHAAAVRAVALFLPDGGRKGSGGRVRQQPPLSRGQGPGIPGDTRFEHG